MPGRHVLTDIERLRGRAIMLLRPCVVCGEPCGRIGRARVCRSCEEIGRACPLLICIDCGAVVPGPYTGMQTHRTWRPRCWRCLDRARWLMSGVPFILARVAIRESARSRMTGWPGMIPDFGHAMDGVLDELPPVRLEEDREPPALPHVGPFEYREAEPARVLLAPCRAKVCATPRLIGTSYCYEHRLMDPAQALLERRMDEAEAGIVALPVRVLRCNQCPRLAISEALRVCARHARRAIRALERVEADVPSVRSLILALEAALEAPAGTVREAVFS